MPPTIPNSNAYLLNLIQNLQKQVTKLGQQGTFATSSSSGGAIAPAVVMGNNPNDPVSPTAVYPNVTTSDDTGATRVTMGQLNDTDYGISITDTLGNTIQLWPTSSHTGLVSPQSTTSDTPVSLSTSPEVICDIGSSGDAILSVNSFISTPTDVSGYVYLLVDGSNILGSTAWLVVGAGGSALGITAQSTSRLTQIASALSPGPHTFTLQYSSSTSGQTVTFSYATITVQPL